MMISNRDFGLYAAAALGSTFIFDVIDLLIWRKLVSPNIVIKHRLLWFFVLLGLIALLYLLFRLVLPTEREVGWAIFFFATVNLVLLLRKRLASIKR